MNSDNVTPFPERETAPPTEPEPALLDAFLAAAPVGLAFVDTQFRYVKVNEALCTINGVSKERMLGQTIAEVVPHVWSQIGHLHRDVMESGVPAINVEVTGETDALPGEPRHWLCNYYPVRDSGGNIHGMGIVVTDITARKQAEESNARRVEEQAALYNFTDRLHRARTLQDVYVAALIAIRDALHCDRASILLFDPAGVMCFAAWHGLSDSYRQAAEGHSPWQPGEIDPTPFGIMDSTQSDIDEPLKSVIVGEGIRALAFIPLMAEGKLIGKFMVYYNTPHKFTDDEFALALTIGRQLAFGVERERAEEQRRQAERALRDSEERLQNIFNQSTAGIAQLDRTGRFVLVNQRFCEITGYSVEELQERTGPSITHPDDQVRDRTLFTQCLQDRAPYVFEKRYVRRDGTPVWVRNNVSPLLDGGESPRYMLVVSIDITDHKRRQSEVEALNERLKRAMRETHHRVKNNLQVVSALVDLEVIEHRDTGVIPLKELERLGGHIRTLAVMHDLLTRSVREDEQQQRVSAVEVIGRLLDLLEKTSGSRLLRSQVDDVELFSKQAVTLSLIINELVSNAVKHAAGNVDVRFQVRDTHGELSVCDDGAGFPDGFDPVVSAHLGLELVLGLIDSDLQGQIFFENLPEGGGRVRIVFPLPEVEE